LIFIQDTKDSFHVVDIKSFHSLVVSRFSLIMIGQETPVRSERFNEAPRKQPKNSTPGFAVLSVAGGPGALAAERRRSDDRGRQRCSSPLARRVLRVSLVDQGGKMDMLRMQAGVGQQQACEESADRTAVEAASGSTPGHARAVEAAQERVQRAVSGTGAAGAELR